MYLLHGSATPVAILREVHCKGWTYRDITKVCEPIHICETLHCNNVYFKIHIKCNLQIKICDLIQVYSPTQCTSLRIGNGEE